jgi:hypothetical protein
MTLQLRRCCPRACRQALATVCESWLAPCHCYRSPTSIQSLRTAAFAAGKPRSICCLIYSHLHLRSLNTQQPAAGLWLCDVRSAAAVEGALVLKADGFQKGVAAAAPCSIFGIILCRLQHAATQTIWPLMLPLHLFFRSLVSALPLPSFLSMSLNRFSAPLPSSSLASHGVVRLTMSALPAQWASAVVVGHGDCAFTGDLHNGAYALFKLTSSSR